MQTKFKRHQEVIILIEPNIEYIEYYGEPAPIKKGMIGKINMLLPNGKYHVEILDKQKNTLAYAPFDEDDLEAI
jgi:hypothetical protein